MCSTSKQEAEYFLSFMKKITRGDTEEYQPALDSLLNKYVAATLLLIPKRAKKGRENLGYPIRVLHLILFSVITKDIHCFLKIRFLNLV